MPSDWVNNGHVFSSEAAIAQGRKLGLVILEIEAGDLLYFPSAWYHEVHNLTAESVAITNAVPWPEQKKADTKSKKDPKNMLGKRTLKENEAMAAACLLVGMKAKN